MDSRSTSGITMIGGVLMAIGSFLAWAVVSGAIKTVVEQAGEKTSQTGIGGGDGWFTLVIGLALIAAGYLAYSGKPLVWFAWAAGIAGVAIAVFEYLSLKSDANDINDLIALTGMDGKASLGIGYWLIAAGALLGIVGVVMGVRKKTA